METENKKLKSTMFTKPNDTVFKQPAQWQIDIQKEVLEKYYEHYHTLKKYNMLRVED